MGAGPGGGGAERREVGGANDVPHLFPVGRDRWLMNVENAMQTPGGQVGHGPATRPLASSRGRTSV